LEIIHIETPGSRSEVRIGEEWRRVAHLIPERGIAIITDENVFAIYGNNFPSSPVFVLPPGERSKQLSTIEDLAGKMLESGIDRSGFVLGIGGGVVCDIAGFLASVYMRGIRCGYVSTTLLSQVDASTGGKNGVDLGGVKNVIGTIRQPEFVICDPEMLLTLPAEEYLSGLAEMIKTAIIGDSDLFRMLEDHHGEVLRRDTGLLEMLVSRSVRFKAKVVIEDENEKGLRRILNFGHTFGHAVETALSVRHGFAIASGMALAAEFSVEKGLCGIDDATRINRLLQLYGYDKIPDVSPSRIEELVRHDKKKSGDDIWFVFITGIGQAVFRKVPVNEVIDFYKRFSVKPQG
jgi:3-dehydroquinate synthase